MEGGPTCLACLLGAKPAVGNERRVGDFPTAHGVVQTVALRILLPFLLLLLFPPLYLSWLAWRRRYRLQINHLFGCCRRRSSEPSDERVLGYWLMGLTTAFCETEGLSNIVPGWQGLPEAAGRATAGMF